MLAIVVAIVLRSGRGEHDGQGGPLGCRGLGGHRRVGCRPRRRPRSSWPGASSACHQSAAAASMLATTAAQSGYGVLGPLGLGERAEGRSAQATAVEASCGASASALADSPANWAVLASGGRQWSTWLPFLRGGQAPARRCLGSCLRSVGAPWTASGHGLVEFPWGRMEAPGWEEDAPLTTASSGCVRGNVRRPRLFTAGGLPGTHDRA
jgi:hypothetical protein